jgi:DNA-binding transcriptional MerR regulator
MHPRLPDLLASIPAEGLTLDELSALASSILDAREVSVSDGRASDRVDPRTVRFYQTLGIVPKPAYIGRRAMYGREHLVRVVVAKQLQAEGHSLAQIHAGLAMHATDDLVAALMKTDAVAAPRARRGEPSPPAIPAPALAPARSPAPAFAPAAAPAAAPLRPFQLAPGVTVLIDPTIVSDPKQLADALAKALVATDATTTKPRGGRDSSIAAERARTPVVAQRPQSRRAPREQRPHGGKQ